MSQNIPRFELQDNEQVRVSSILQRHVPKYFPTHRHNYYEMVIITSCEEGDFSHSIDFVSYPLLAGRVYFIAPGQAHAWNVKSYSGEYEGYLVTFNEAFLLTGNQNLERQVLKLFDPLNSEPYLEFDPSGFNETFPTMKLLEDEYNKEQSDYFLLRSLLETLILYMKNLKPQGNDKIDLSCQRLVEARKQIEKYYKSERNVEFYARKMELSSKRLNEIFKEVLGQTVTQVLHHRLLLEAKRELVSQSKTIQNISDELGFENPSYFSRFFKKNEGVSPTEFLKQMFK
ncbi:MAG TPA: AraC family transcriptional regulator [Arcobacter sp.]|nr:AraC family transcriptional regulator [Arcobacter sp.]